MAKNKSGFKYFVPIQKSYEEDGSVYVQGIASGILEDRDDERMSPNVLQKFVTALPLPLTNSHPRAGDVLGDMGDVIKAKMTPDDELFVKARLDTDNPATSYFLKQIQKGKSFAFSIEGVHAVVKTVFSDKLQKFINEFQDLVPTGISITSAPSYTPSFLEVVTKSYKPDVDTDETTSNNEGEASDKLKDDESMNPKGKDEAVVQEQVEAVVEEKAVEEVVEEAVEEVVEDSTEAEVEVAVKGKDEAEVVAEEDSPEESQAEEVVEEVTEEEVVEVAEKSVDLSEVISKIDKLEKSINEMVELQGKAFKTNIDVLKSVHEDIEVMKTLPLQKKSKAAVVSKSFGETASVDEKVSFTGIAQSIVG